MIENHELTLGFIPIARPTFDMGLAYDQTQAVHAQLQQAGFTIIGLPELVLDLEELEEKAQELQSATLDLLVMVQASFADSTMVTQLVELVNAPLLMWALPEERVGGRLRLNSFCGINLAAHGLKRRELTYDYVYAEPSDKLAMEKTRNLALAGKVKGQLQDARIGRIGENPDGFDTCLVNKIGLKQRLGVEIVQLELDNVFEGTRQADPQKVEAVATQIRESVTGLETLDKTATHGTLSTFVTLDEIAEEQQLNGLAVRCWPEFFTDLGCSACGAMSMLSDKQTPSSCEADVNGTITQLILQWMSGEPAFGSDLVSFDVEEDVAILWHCGLAPRSMADPDVEVRGALHSNRQMPLLMEFPLKPGRVTLARLSEATGEFRLVIAGGEMLKAPPSFTGTTGTLRFDSGTQAVMDTIIGEGLEHHLSLTYGNYENVLVALAKMLKIPVLRL